MRPTVPTKYNNRGQYNYFLAESSESFNQEGEYSLFINTATCLPTIDRYKVEIYGSMRVILIKGKLY